MPDDHIENEAVRVRIESPDDSEGAELDDAALLLGIWLGGDDETLEDG